MRAKLFLALTGTLLLSGCSGSIESVETEQPQLTAKVAINFGTEIEARIADTASERAVGLGEIEQLAENEGMLFLFPDKNVRTFWMKDVEYPIDIIWLEDGKIVGVEEVVQPEDPPISRYSSPANVNQVLEVNAGFVAEQGLKIGQNLDIRLKQE